MKIAIIGMGEIGTALLKVIKSRTSNSTEIHIKDKEDKSPIIADYMHICFPCDGTDNKKFIRDVNRYYHDYKPRLTIIHSTVLVGTSASIRGLVAHVPLRGRHDNLADGIRKYTLFIGADDKDACKEAVEYFKKLDFDIYNKCKSLRDTELAKLLSLTQFAYNIEFTRYAKKCCDKLGVNYSVIQDYTTSYNKGILDLEKEEGVNFLKCNLEPPKGKIGGHCVLEALEKIHAQESNGAIKAFLDTNKRI